MGDVKTFRFFLYDAFKWIGSLAFRRSGRRGEAAHVRSIYVAGYCDWK